MGRHRSGQTRAARDGGEGTEGHAQEFLGMRYRHRLPGGGRSAVAHHPHDPDLRSIGPGEAGVHPQFRPGGPATGRGGAGADLAARRDLHRAQRQPRVFRLRHQHRGRAADRRSRQAAERPEGADAGEPARAAGRAARPAADARGAHGVPAAAHADRRVLEEPARQAARFRRRHRRGDPEGMPRGAADGLVRRRQHRDPADRRLDLDRAREERQLLHARRPLRHPLLERKLRPRVLRARHVLRAFQRRRARRGHPRPLPSARDRPLHPGDERGHGGARDAAGRAGREAALH